MIASPAVQDAKAFLLGLLHLQPLFQGAFVRSIYILTTLLTILTSTLLAATPSPRYIRQFIEDWRFIEAADPEVGM